MKRLTWLLLAVFCLALAQVQPVDGLPAKAKACGCCKIPGPCGMPGCCPPPAAVPTVFNSTPTVRVASSPARRHAEPVGGAAEKFYASFVSSAAVRRAIVASAAAARAARVPLFKAHGSLLI